MYSTWEFSEIMYTTLSDILLIPTRTYLLCNQPKGLPLSIMSSIFQDLPNHTIRSKRKPLLPVYRSLLRKNCLQHFFLDNTQHELLTTTLFRLQAICIDSTLGHLSFSSGKMLRRVIIINLSPRSFSLPSPKILSITLQRGKYQAAHTPPPPASAFFYSV